MYPQEGTKPYELTNKRKEKRNVTKSKSKHFNCEQTVW